MTGVARKPPEFFINSTKVGLDVDGVICNFHERIIEIAKERGLAEFFPADWRFITSWHFSSKFAKIFNETKHDPAFWLGLDTYPGCLESIDFEVEGYITARPCEPIVTCEWIQRVGFQPASVITTSGPKVPALKSLGIEVYVDDKPENFDEINGAGIKCFLMDRPWNRMVDTDWVRDGGLRISSLSEVGKYLREFEGPVESPPLIEEV